jgi:hypothetical protein
MLVVKSKILPRSTTRRIVEYVALSCAADQAVVRSRDVRARALAAVAPHGAVIHAHAALALSDLADCGRLVRVSRGAYAITDAGRDALAVMQEAGREFGGAGEAGGG